MQQNATGLIRLLTLRSTLRIDGARHKASDKQSEKAPMLDRPMT